MELVIPTVPIRDNDRVIGRGVILNSCTINWIDLPSIDLPLMECSTSPTDILSFVELSTITSDSIEWTCCLCRSAIPIFLVVIDTSKIGVEVRDWDEA